jgi:hypothetical protein
MDMMLSNSAKLIISSGDNADKELAFPRKVGQFEFLDMGAYTSMQFKRMDVGARAIIKATVGTNGSTLMFYTTGTVSTSGIALSGSLFGKWENAFGMKNLVIADVACSASFIPPKVVTSFGISANFTLGGASIAASGYIDPMSHNFGVKGTVYNLTLSALVGFCTGENRNPAPTPSPSLMPTYPTTPCKYNRTLDDGIVVDDPNFSVEPGEEGCVSIITPSPLPSPSALPKPAVDAGRLQSLGLFGINRATFSAAESRFVANNVIYDAGVAFAVNATLLGMTFSGYIKSVTVGPAMIAHMGVPVPHLHDFEVGMAVADIGLGRLAQLVKDSHILGLALKNSIVGLAAKIIPALKNVSFILLLIFL